MIKFVISPAKNMQDTSDDFIAHNTPVFIDEANELLNYLKTLSFDELKDVYKANDKIVLLNQGRLQNMDLENALSYALFSYQGIQYQYMAPSVLQEDEITYLQKHLYILSGFYGLLKPFDRIVPYRLEMQAKLRHFKANNLYAYWQDKIYKEIKKEASIIIDLASGEYNKVLKPYIDLPYVTIHFKENENGKLKEKGVYVKMARGAMIRYCAEHKVESLKALQKFNELDYQFDANLSNETDYYFVRSIEK